MHVRDQIDDGYSYNSGVIMVIPTGLITTASGSFASLVLLNCLLILDHRSLATNSTGSPHSPLIAHSNFNCAKL